MNKYYLKNVVVIVIVISILINSKLFVQGKCLEEFNNSKIQNTLIVNAKNHKANNEYNFRNIELLKKYINSKDVNCTKDKFILIAKYKKIEQFNIKRKDSLYEYWNSNNIKTNIKNKNIWIKNRIL